MQSAPPAAARAPTFGEATRFWARLGFISFGGPAGQIAIMHREVVTRRGWLDERAFHDALGFCMLLPGPEALQLAIYLGWRLHGIRGGLVAGLGFIGPAIALLLGLSWVYATSGDVPVVAGVLVGLQAAVVALVLQALWSLGRRALDVPLHLLLAVGAFLALQFGHVPFPLVVLAAACAGLARGWSRPAATHAGSPMQPRGGTLRTLWWGLALWAVPLAVVVATLGAGSRWTQLYLFFTRAALVTFGGAYAVLGYVTSHLVDGLGWLSAQQAVAGLALAETTPGPLIIVLQFMGYMSGWNQPAPLSPAWSALLAALLASWATFLPSFVFIFLGAPHLERLTREPRINAALRAVTAAVVGVIATLAWLLASVVLFPGGWTQGPRWACVAIAIGAGLLLARRDAGVLLVLALAAGAGVATHSY